MKIETKFNVNDLTQRKYDRNNETVMVCEIMEILPIVCIAGTQIFYMIRCILLHNQVNYKKGVENFKWIVDRAIPKKGGYHRFREDELIPCSDEYKKIILGK